MTHLNFEAITASLLAVQRVFPEINARLKLKRDDMTDRVIDNMLAGYRFMDGLIDAPGDLLASDRLADLLELNHIVLCGHDRKVRKEYRRHLEATQEKFYRHIQWLKPWYRKHINDSHYKRAAGVFVGILCQPQLFIEGNHRTGSLIISIELVRHGFPPFVLTPSNAEGYFNPAAVIKFSNRLKTFDIMFKIPGIKRQFGVFLQQHTDPQHLLPTA